ncbi:hypothetical protein [Sphingorhabdus sp.]|uniref:hypothetical protein n=1 Tax=Sphingorhabdus sp. TaxID=1902408 RepID=UPI0039195856
MTDFADFDQWQEVEQALHGNLQPLLALLRSDVPLSKNAREYIADEIERAPDKRFRRQRNADLEVKENDRTLLHQVFTAKMEIALRKLGLEADDHVVFEAFEGISDRDALDFLCENYGLDLNQHDLDNALRRSPPGIFDPRGPRRQMKKLNL